MLKIIYILLTNSYHQFSLMKNKEQGSNTKSDREVQTLRFLGGRNYAYTAISLISMYLRMTQGVQERRCLCSDVNGTRKDQINPDGSMKILFPTGCPKGTIK
jgi:hypothetical protein